MTPAFLALILGVQLPAGPGGWLHVKSDSKPSKEWLDLKKAVEKSVAALKVDSKANRLKKFEQLGREVGGYDVDPKIAYKAASYWFAFKPETEQAKVSTLYINACKKARATTDPEFMRMAYSCLCIGNAAQRWPGLGPRLMAIFPGDVRLKEAVMQQCVQALVTYEDAKVGLKLVEEGERNGMPTIRVLARKANIYYHMYEERKLKSDLDRSISFFEQCVKVDTDAERRETAQMWANLLKKKRAAGEYKEG